MEASCVLRCCTQWHPVTQQLSYSPYGHVQNHLPMSMLLLSLLTFLCSNHSFGVPVWQREIFMNSPSFHGAMTKKEAELTLENHGGNRCYLTRYCTIKKSYYLSVMTKQEEQYKHDHFVLKVEHYSPHNINIEGTEKQFNKISDLLEFYESNPVNFEVSNIGIEVQNRRISDTVSLGVDCYTI